MKSKYNVSLTSRRDALYDAYLEAAGKHGVDYRQARDTFSAAFTRVKFLSYPTKPHPEHSTLEERAAYEQEQAHPTTQTDKARVLDGKLAAAIEHPEWLAAALLKPKKEPVEQQAALETRLKRVFRRIAVLQDAETRLREAQEERKLIEGKLALLAQRERADALVAHAAAHCSAHGYSPAG